MNDLLQRLTARSRGHRISGIRPAQTPPVFPWSKSPAPPIEEEAPQKERRLVSQTEPKVTPRPAPSPQQEKNESEKVPSTVVTVADLVAASTPKPPTQEAPATEAPASRRRLAQPPFSDPIPLGNPRDSGRAESSKAADRKPAESAVQPKPHQEFPPAPAPLTPRRPAATTVKADTPTPTVEISIGTIEVGVPPKPTVGPTQSVKRRAAATPQLSLKGYLNRRNRQGPRSYQ